jgi:MoxR-like ATPase
MTDPTVNSVVKLRSSYLDPLDRENSVLFLDEYNRGSRGNRAALLDLISAHRIEGEDLPEVKEARAKKGLSVNDGYRHFDNLLFTVAAMNPEDDFSGIDSTADSLSSAEKSRFSLTIKDFDSRKGPTLDYIRGYIEDTICAMDESRPDF